MHKYYHFIFKILTKSFYEGKFYCNVYLCGLKRNTMKLSQILSAPVQKAVQELFDISIDKVEFQITRKEFEGDITMVIFPLLKVIKGSPVEIGSKIGTYLVENIEAVVRFNVVSGFLNIVVSDE